MNDFILPLSAPRATDPEIVGPKAANLALLGRAGLPTPGGFCLTAAAYRRQINAIGLGPALAQFASADLRAQRKLSVEIRLGLYEQPIAREIVGPLLAMWRDAKAALPGFWVVRSSALIEDRAGTNF